jgi:ketosteroid isomerase-like protein
MDALGARDLDRLVALSEPGVEWHSFFAALGEGTAYRGHDGTAQYLRDLDDAFESAYAEIDGALTTGQVTLLAGRLRYRGRDSGVEAAADAGWMLQFRAGKLVMFRAFRDPERVFARVGLAP